MARSALEMVVDSEQLGFEATKKEIHGPEISQHWFRSRAIYFRSVRVPVTDLD